MQKSKLSAHTVYAIKQHNWSDPEPALLIEAELWKVKEAWGFWDLGADQPLDTQAQKTKALVYAKAEKGERAGRSDSWRAGFWKIGLPTLRMETPARCFTQSDWAGAIRTKPFPIFQEALRKMNLLALFAEGHDGRKTEDIHLSVEVEVEMMDGTFEGVRVVLELLRPQQYVSDWNTYVGQKQKDDRAKADWETKQAQRKAENDRTAADIVSRVDRLTGSPERYDRNDERYDLHRKFTSSGISTTYEVSEQLLLKLIALAEQGRES